MNSIVEHAIHIKNEIMKHVNMSVKIIVHTKKSYSWNPRNCICENGKYLKGIADDSKIGCDEIIYVVDFVSIKMTNTIARIVSIHCHSK